MIKIGATRCQILRLNCIKVGSGWGSAPHPAGVAYSAPPDSLAGLRGPASNGRRRGLGGEERRGGAGREGKVVAAGREGRGGGWTH